jgi:hypothetical protein
MIVQMSVNFNGVETLIKGTVVIQYEGKYLVDFEKDGTKFRGVWPQDYCTILSKGQLDTPGPSKSP